MCRIAGEGVWRFKRGWRGFVKFQGKMLRVTRGWRGCVKLQKSF